MINVSNLSQVSYSQSMTYKQSSSEGQFSLTTSTNTSVAFEESTLAAIYEPSEDTETVDENGSKKPTYQVDMKKVQEMKDDLDKRMVDLFKSTVNSSGTKQISGARGVLSLSLSNSTSLEIEYSEEAVAQAKEDLADGGYWSAEETSDRLVDFAKALSGGNPDKIQMLQDTFKSAFEEIEDMFGGTLPDISYDTYDLTMEKFSDWENEGE